MRWYAIYNDGGPRYDGLVKTGETDLPGHFACREEADGIHYMGPYRTREHVDEVVATLNGALDAKASAAG